MAKKRRIPTDHLPEMLQQYEIYEESIGKGQVRITIGPPGEAGGKDYMYIRRRGEYGLRGLAWHAHNSLYPPKKHIRHWKASSGVTRGEGVDYWQEKLDMLAAKAHWQPDGDRIGYIVPLCFDPDDYGPYRHVSTRITVNARGYATSFNPDGRGLVWLHTPHAHELLAWLRGWRIELHRRLAERQEERERQQRVAA